MAKRKNGKSKNHSSKIWLGLRIFAFVFFPLLCISLCLLAYYEVQQITLFEFNSTPGPWYKCSFIFADDSTKVTLMRRRLPGIVGFHAEFGLHMRIEKPENDVKSFSLVYTESSITDFYLTEAILKDNQSISMMLIETYGSIYRINMNTVEEISFTEVIEEGERLYLGHFNGVSEFIPSTSSVIALDKECDILSPATIS